MTTQTETAEAPEGSGVLPGFIVTLAFVAFFTWLGGVALNKGFGVHVPFIAGFILLAVGLSVVKMATAEVAQVWHGARVGADITLLAATMAAQEAIQQQQGDGLAGLLAKLDGVTDTDNGGHL